MLPQRVGDSGIFNVPANVPSSIHLLSLDSVAVETTVSSEQKRVLLRVLNIHQRGEGPHAVPALFTLKGLLAVSPSRICVRDAVEVTLNGVAECDKSAHVEENEEIFLGPLQIRTFQVTLAACK